MLQGLVQPDAVGEASGVLGEAQQPASGHLCMKPMPATRTPQRHPRPNPVQRRPGQSRAAVGWIAE
jgi:hypothetical protein